MPRKKSPPRIQWDRKKITLYIALPLLVGILLSTFIPRPKIGTITLNAAIDDYETKFALEQLRYAKTHPEIRAVVLILDCPGGTINGTELLYLELLHLRQSKPVVTMIEGLSASGAFYLSVGTDYIISNPSAMVGNVGVVGNIPDYPRIYEETYSTGPYKLWGFPRDEYIRQMDMMKSTFLEAVLTGRNGRLKATPDKILRGEIYPANEAYRLGLIDEIGPFSASIEKAANLAHVSHYQVVDIWETMSKEKKEDDSNTGFFALDENGNLTNRPKEPGFYYLYIPDFEGWLP